MRQKLAASPHLLAALERARGGDGQAAELLLADLEPLLHYCARHFKPEPMEFDDAMQECRLAMVRTLRAWRPDGGASFITLLVRCCQRAFSHEHRKLTRRAKAGFLVQPLDTLEWASDPADLFEPVMDRTLVAAAIGMVPPKPKEWIALKAVLEEENAGEVGRRTGVSRSAVNLALKRWLDRVRRVVGKEGEIDAEDRQE